MRDRKRARRRSRAGAVGSVLVGLLLFAAGTAWAGPPVHRLSFEAGGFDHACGVAVDSQGDLYVASAGEAKILVFGPEHRQVGEQIGEIADSHEPCGLAVNSEGDLFVSERAEGKVVRYRPNAYPFSGTPTYGPREVIDSSGDAKGIAVDPHENRLYVAEGNRVALYNADGSLGIDETDPIAGECSGGEFKLVFEGEETNFLPCETNAEEVEMALTALVGSGNVSVAEGEPGYSFDVIVTFTGALSNTDVGSITANEVGLTGTIRIFPDEKEGYPGENHVEGFSGYLGEGVLTEATGVAAYSVPEPLAYNNLAAFRHLFVADAAGTGADRIEVFGGSDIRALRLRRERFGAREGEGFEFGPAGPYLAADPGNLEEAGKCREEEARQACTAGHFFLYDAGRQAVDEFDASGEFLDKLTDPSLADAEPSAIAVDRSGGPNDGSIYVTAGSSSGAKVLGFGPLLQPSRPSLGEPLSKVLATASAVASDSRGDVYVVAGATIHVYGPDGVQITSFEDDLTPLADLAVDSSGHVYVLETKKEKGMELPQVTYYTPSSYPPGPATSYSPHAAPVATRESGWPEFCPTPEAIAVNPGPGAGKDRLFVNTSCATHEYAPAAEGSGLLNGEFAAGLNVGRRSSIAVDGESGEVYFGGGSIVDAQGEEVLSKVPGPVRTIAVDQANGHVVEFAEGEAAREYDAAGAFVAQFGASTAVVRPNRLAIDNACALHTGTAGEPEPLAPGSEACRQYDPADGTVYIAFDDTNPEVNPYDVTAFGPLSYGEAPTVVTKPASGVGGGRAQLNGSVDPDGLQVEACRFEYLSEAEYEKNEEEEEPSFEGAATAPCVPGAEAIGRGFSAVAVHAELEGLDPQARYRYRLVAENAADAAAGEALRFGPPALWAEPARPVLYTEATLHARIDPAGLATSYRFQYGPAGGEYDHETPPLQLSGAAGATEVQETIAGLAEGSAYRFRAIVESEAGAIEGPEQGLVTLQRRAPEECANAEYRTGFSANLPDCRAYELVTPAQTAGLIPEAAGNGNVGTGFANWLTVPRGPAAGERLSYFTPGTLPGFEGNGFLDGYRAERGGGAHPPAGWQSALFAPTYAESVPDLTSNHILKQQSVSADQLYSFWRFEPAETLAGTLPTGVYLRVADGAADPACVPLVGEVDFEAVGCGSLGTDLLAQSRYVSPGGTHVIFTSAAHLQEDAPPPGTTAIYERPAGSSQAEVLSLLPGGITPASGQGATYLGATEDGRAVAFELGGALYLRREGQTSEAAPAAGAFAGLSEDGSLLFYTSAAKGSNAGTLRVFDLATGASTKIAEAAVFVAVSPDGSHVLYSTEEGGPKLYEWDRSDGAASFVAALDPRDFEGFDGRTEVNLGAWTEAVGPGGPRAFSPTRSTPDGRYFLFESHAALTGYDNEGFGEIYRYQPAGPAGERIDCVSCDPSGATPSADATLERSSGGGLDPTAVLPNLTDDGGAVFFQSAERLLPEDANAVSDVYEWRAPGSGACRRPGGCLALISSGQGEGPSDLYAMSADGSDVFLRTQERLLGSDAPGTPSIYDAREGGGIPEAGEEEACQGDACQGLGAPAPALALPESGGAGGGNLPHGGKARCPKGKRAVRRHGKPRCLRRRRHRRHPRHQHRHRVHQRSDRNGGRGR